VHDGEVDPQKVFFFDEVWLSLRGEVNYQNNRYWSAGNQRLFQELPLHDEEVVSGLQQLHARQMDMSFTTIQLMETVM
jgi:hypothetical protein